MNVSLAPPITTTEELLACPDDGVERELIRGQLWEKPMTRRNPRHSSVEAEIARLLGNWVKGQPKPRGRVLSGEVGVRLRRSPDTTVGIDVAYIDAEVAAAVPDNARLIDGIPVLAVEILSPSDKHEEVTAKVNEYLAVGVPLVWVVDPDFRTVRVHHPGREPEMFNAEKELTGDPQLPGFRVAVAEPFE